MLCEHLEDYICRLLSEEDVAAFEEHLESCSNCSEAVARELALFGLVTKAVHTLEPAVPERINEPVAVVGVSPTSGPSTMPTTTLSAGLAVATSVVALVILLAVVRAPGSKTSQRRQVPDEVVVQNTYVAPPKIEVASDIETLTVNTGDPNIKIILMNVPEARDVNFLSPASDQRLALGR